MKTLNCIVAFLAFAFVSFGSVVPVDAQGRWIAAETVDDFTGETRYMAFQPSDDVTFGIGCTGDEIANVSVVLILDDGISRDGSFQYRVDDSDIRDAEWTDGNEVIGLTAGRAVSFIREISGGRELRVRIPRFRSSNIDGTFNLEGMATHLSEVERRCDF